MTRFKKAEPLTTAKLDEVATIFKYLLNDSAVPAHIVTFIKGIQTGELAPLSTEEERFIIEGVKTLKSVSAIHVAGFVYTVASDRKKVEGEGKLQQPERFQIFTAPFIPESKSNEECCADDIKNAVETYQKEPVSKNSTLDLYERIDAICFRYGHDLEEIKVKFRLWLPQRPENKQLDLMMVDSAAYPAWKLKHLQAMIDNPFFALAPAIGKTKMRKYTDNKGGSINLTCNAVYGWATVWDQDILYFCVSKMMAAINRDEKIHRTLQTTGEEILKSINKGRCKFGVKDHQELEMALKRLRNTLVETTIAIPGPQGEKLYKPFNFIEDYTFVTEKKGDRIGKIRITLPEWVFGFMLNKTRLLTLDDNFLTIRGGIERRLYEIGHKRCGKQVDGEGSPLPQNITLEDFRRKIDSQREVKYFRRDIKNMLEKNNHRILDLHITYTAKDDKLNFVRVP